jgi:hypothetical protein
LKGSLILHSTIQEGVGVALAEGRMTGRNLDIIHALGAVSIHHPLADAVFRVKYSNEASSYPDALAGMRNLAISLNALGGWRLKRSRLAEMAKAVLDYWLSDTCPVCEGRGWEKPDGSPALSNTPCGACAKGSRLGKRPFPWNKKPKLRERDDASRERRRSLRSRRQKFDRLAEQHKHLLCAIEAVESRIGEKMIAKLGRRVRSL